MKKAALKARSNKRRGASTSAYTITTNVPTISEADEVSSEGYIVQYIIQAGSVRSTVRDRRDRTPKKQHRVYFLTVRALKQAV